MRDFPFSIYDAHHHFWDLNAVHYPWLATKGVTRFFGDPAAIQKDYLPTDYLIDIANLPVEKSVHIQVGADDNQHLLEAQTIQQHADDSGLANAIVSFCSLEQGTVVDQLSRLTKLGNFRGVRQIIGRSPEEDKQTGTNSLLTNPAWHDGLKELNSLGLSFDLQLIPEQMTKAAEVFAQIEDLPIALCHCGSPWYRDDQGWKLWQEGMRELASLPNMYCKISGLSMFDHNWTAESLQPIVEFVVETFGARRCMFGSNFPVDKLHTTYQKLCWAYLETLKHCDQKELQSIFKGTCEKFYKLA